MTAQIQNGDFRDYRPAAVILIDFVKHSKRQPDEVHVIQRITEDILADAQQSLRITDCVFNHTGDGWMCMLLGDDSARAMDFVNLCFPSLWQRLEPYKQKLRAATDYGMIHLRRPHIGSNPVSFETPEINAARLEAVAQPNQILCTCSVFALFSPHYDDMFSHSQKLIETKDRKIVAYEITPRSLPNIRAIISDLLLASPERLGSILRGTKKVLIIDDDREVLAVLSQMLRPYIEKERIVEVSDAREALHFFKPNEFIAVITDFVMPYMDGLELTRLISSIDPNVPVVIVSGYFTHDAFDRFLDSGAVLARFKPFGAEVLLRALSFASAFGTPSILQSRLRFITDNPTEFLRWILEIADDIGKILQRVNEPHDVGQSMLRHKAKQIANEILTRLVPGGDVVRYLENTGKQIRKIERLCSVVRPYETLGLEQHFQNMVTDYGKANKKVEMTLECNLNGTPNLKVLQSVALLIASEFIDNALDAIDRKGVIKVDVSWDRTHQQLCILVTDNGPGIPPDMISRLFHSMKTTKGEGRGMGLSLVKQACDVFRGTPQYLRDETTSFLATLCLPPENNEQNSKQ